MRIDITNVAREWVYYASDILREFLSHNFVSGLRTLNLKNLKINKN